MHEMALTEGILRILEDQAVSNGFTKVKTVWLEVGPLSHAEPEALKFCFENARRDTIADGAELVIVTPPAKAWCMDCSKEVEIVQRGDSCPECNGYKLQVTSGEELRVKELEVE